MDTSGNVFFPAGSDGGDIILQSFTAAQGGSGVWTPDWVKRSAYNLTGGGSVAGSTSVTTTSSSSSSSGSSGSSTNSGTSIANMSISQTGANSAITTIDAAISYVQAERSNLGAIQNG